MQALMLAAGMGKRLGKYTQGNTKCMLEVAGEKLVDRAIESVKRAKIKRFVFVVGYKGERLQNYIETTYAKSDMEFVFVYNNDYSNTNNIYSLYLAKDEMIKDDTILLESDLIYDENSIATIVADKREDLIAVAKYKEWMDGTVVRLNSDSTVKEMISKKRMTNEHIDEYYKTVNIYKFSKKFASNVYIPFLDAYQQVVGKSSYYESVLSCILNIENIHLHAFDMSEVNWYEIDDEQDLDIADTIFSKETKKYDKLLAREGGYWRFNLLDASSYGNPYFPIKAMNEKIVRNYETLLTQRPSCIAIQNLNASRVFNVDEANILVGNGASDLIYAVGKTFKNKKVVVCNSSSKEYERWFKESQIVSIDNKKTNFEVNFEELYLKLDEIDCLVIVSPDNLTGIHVGFEKMLKLIETSSAKGVHVILDESFVDFADKEERKTLIDDKILEKYSNLIVIKSISKSHGNPGLRLGVLATSNKEKMEEIKKNISIWNINSFAEYYLQIFNLYSKEYDISCDKIAEERHRISKKYASYKNIRVYKSQANYIVLEFLEHKSKQIALKMLENENILIKDLSTNAAFKGMNCVRIGIRSREENELILNAVIKYTNKERGKN